MRKPDFREELKKMVKRHHDEDFDRVNDARITALHREIDESLTTNYNADPEVQNLLKEIKREKERQFQALDRRELMVKFKEQCMVLANVIENDNSLPKKIRTKIPALYRKLHLNDPKVVSWAKADITTIKKYIADLENVAGTGYSISAYQQDRMMALSFRVVLAQLYGIAKTIIRFKTISE